MTSVSDVQLMGRLLVAILLGSGMALWVQRGSRRAPPPPGFSEPIRNLMAAAVLALTLFLGVFVPLATFDLPQDVDIESLGYGQLFLSHGLLLASVILWAGLGWSGGRSRRATVRRLPASVPGDAELEAPDAGWVRGLRLATGRRLFEELRAGLLAGLGAWAAVLASMLALGTVLALTGRGAEWLEAPPSPLIVFLAGLPVIARVAVSVSAGVVEELFFRGLLQPRIGIGASTACFVLGHLSYEQPLMLVGLVVLSTIYGVLARRRGNIWASVIAHTLFDMVQLLIVIPATLASGGVSPVAG